MIRILKHFIFTFIVTAIAFAFGCRASDPIPQRISAPIVSVKDIIDDTKSGNKSYERKIVKVNGTVRFMNPDFSALYLETGSSVNKFQIIHGGKTLSLVLYKVGENYEFTLYIKTQFNGIIETVVRAHIASTEIKQVTIESLEAQMRSDSKSYVGYPIRFTAKIDELHGSIKFYTSELKGEDRVLIYFYPDEDTYIEGQTYTFLLFVPDMNKSVLRLYPLKN